MTNRMAKWLGGSPLAVLGWLVFVSILVGIILAALGLDPDDIIRGVERLIRSIWNIGFDTFGWLWRYFLLGAAIVIPIWLMMRLPSATVATKTYLKGRYDHLRNAKAGVRMGEKMNTLKSVGSVFLGLAVFVGLAILSVVFIYGAVWVSEHVVEYVMLAAQVVF
jgi:hypothetical protein